MPSGRGGGNLAEAPRTPDALHVQRDHRCGRVFEQVVDDVADVEVGFVASGDQLGEAQSVGRPARQQRAQHATALRNHRHAT